ncbi:hypothetical protein HPB49_021172 [Dermacentor silvarum]|uniref:Uncharacterized protein n=1 Tax=Dermacentor silvarum TaxID=543639 RepID=A0ACB8DG02_DERSI|nr:hypothetical protein HPB49_021172 [Dermacentor silvarum]
MMDTTEAEGTAEIVQPFWKIDSMGIIDLSECPSDKNLVQFKETVKESSCRYTVAVPWKDDRKLLSGDNRDTAVNRRQKLAIRLVHHDGLVE